MFLFLSIQNLIYQKKQNNQTNKVFGREQFDFFQGRKLYNTNTKLHKSCILKIENEQFNNNNNNNIKIINK